LTTSVYIVLGQTFAAKNLIRIKKLSGFGETFKENW